jgi:hypothetical protein
LQHRESTFFFQVTTGSTYRFEIVYSPGDHYVTDGDSVPRWGEVPGVCKRWLGLLRRELKAVNPWAELQNREPFSARLSDVDNSRFTESEIAMIEDGLAQVSIKIRATSNLTGEQIRILDERLEYLIQASKRLGRIDWRNAFVGAVFGLVLQSFVNPQTAIQIVSLASTIFGHIFSAGVPRLDP